MYRRFSDFLGLHDKLVEKYMTQGRIVPPAPEKSVIGGQQVPPLVKVTRHARGFTQCPVLVHLLDSGLEKWKLHASDTSLFLRNDEDKNVQRRSWVTRICRKEEGCVGTV